MNDQQPPLDPAEVSAHLKVHRITQIELSSVLGVSQSQISRVLSGHTSGRSKLLHKICVYAEYQPELPSPSRITTNESLISAIADVWDGTPEHADAIAVVIRSLKALSPSVLMRPRRKN